jgi:hypothetical protein
MIACRRMEVLPAMNDNRRTFPWEKYPESVRGLPLVEMRPPDEVEEENALRALKALTDTRRKEGTLPQPK